MKAFEKDFGSIGAHLYCRVIPGARLHAQKGVGHEIPPEILPETIPIILEHLGGAR
jgi:hypothetical protein